MSTTLSEWLFGPKPACRIEEATVAKTAERLINLANGSPPGAESLKLQLEQHEAIPGITLAVQRGLKRGGGQVQRQDRILQINW
jgi:hypothetical protein